MRPRRVKKKAEPEVRTAPRPTSRARLSAERPFKPDLAVMAAPGDDFLVEPLDFLDLPGEQALAVVVSYDDALRARRFVERTQGKTLARQPVDFLRMEPLSGALFAGWIVLDPDGYLLLWADASRGYRSALLFADPEHAQAFLTWSGGEGRVVRGSLYPRAPKATRSIH